MTPVIQRIMIGTLTHIPLTGTARDGPSIFLFIGEEKTMKKLLTIMLVAVLAVVLAVTASADLYNPEYYGVLKVENGAITVDGAVDAAYGEPIFYYEAFGPDATEEQIGDYTQSSNWFFTKDTSENLEDVLALIHVEARRRSV